MGDNTFTYTKYFRDNMSRKDNSNIKYIDVDLQLDEEVISMYDRYTVPGNIFPGNSKTHIPFSFLSFTSCKKLNSSDFVSFNLLIISFFSFANKFKKNKENIIARKIILNLN